MHGWPATSTAFPDRTRLRELHLALIFGHLEFPA